MIHSFINLILPYTLLIGGLLILTKSADLVIQGSIVIAKKFRVSKLLIGLTIIAFGTSLPELVASIQAALADAPGLALGNIIGSNIANILLIIGVAAIISPMLIKENKFKTDLVFLTFATLLFSLLAYKNLLFKEFGYLMFILLVLFLIFSYFKGKRFGKDSISTINFSDLNDTESISTPILFTKIIFGIIGLIAGANILVSNAVSIARNIGVSEEVIGLTMVAIGTSLPELATVIAAARKKETDLIVGNIIGSNIFNILGVIGITSIVTAIPVSEDILKLDLWIMNFVTLVFIVFIFNFKVIKKYLGVLFLLAYIVYVTLCYL